MLQIRKILHPTDFSPCANAAFVHAVHLARQHEAALHVLHVAPTLESSHLRDALSAVLDEEAFYERQQKEADTQMRALLDEYEVDDLRVRWVPVRGLDTTKKILEYVAGNEIDLVVLGTHGHRGIRHWLLGSVAEHVVRRASCPVMTVKAREESKGVTVLTLRKLVVPVDFSLYSHHALQYALVLAELDNAHVQLLHVVDVVQQPDFYEVGLVGQSEMSRLLIERARDQLESFHREASAGYDDVSFHVVEGYAPHEIVAFAETEHADAIVIATHGLRGLERDPLGSVTERVVRGASCPVFIARPFGRSLLSGDSAPEHEWVAPPEG